jgi:hypothetical protein
MTHVRQQLRERIATTLNGLPSTGRNVFRSRARRLERNETPALFIYTRTESDDPLTGTEPRVLQRELTVYVEVVALVPEPDDVIDAACAEVEQALANDRRLGGLARDLLLVATSMEFSDDAEAPGGSARLEYRIRYMTTDAAPDVAL